MGACCGKSKKGGKLKAPLTKGSFNDALVNLYMGPITSVDSEGVVVILNKDNRILTNSDPTIWKALPSLNAHNLQSQIDVLDFPSTSPSFKTLIVSHAGHGTEPEIEKSLLACLNHAKQLKLNSITIPDLDPAFKTFNRILYVDILVRVLIEFAVDTSTLKSINLTFMDKASVVKMSGDLDARGVRDSMGRGKDVALVVADPDYKTRFSALARRGSFLDDKTRMPPNILKGYVSPKIFFHKAREYRILRKRQPFNKVHFMKMLITTLGHSEAIDTEWINTYIPAAKTSKPIIRRLFKTFKVAHVRRCNLTVGSEPMSMLLQSRMKSIFLKMKTMKSVNNLNMKVDLDKISAIKLRNIVISIGELRNLAISIENSPTDIEIETITKDLYGLTNLKSLTLKFKFYEVRTRLWVTYLRESLRQLRGLKELTLYFNFYFNKNFTELNLISLIQTLQELSFVPKLNFHMSISKGVENHIPKIFQTLAYMNNIHRLSLEFSFAGINDQGVAAVGTMIQSLNRLTDLDINFKFCDKVTQDGYNTIVGSIAYRYSLASLSLDISSAVHLRGETLLRLTQSLSTLRNFQKLHATLTLSKNIHGSIYTQAFDEFAMIKQLQTLDMDFVSNSIIGDQQIESFSASLAQFTQLRVLDINCSGCSHLTDGCLIFLAPVLPLTLRCLKIDFSQIEGITSKGLYTLSSHLESLRSLEELDLCFNECKFITDEGIENLSSALGNLYLMGKLTLEFRKCNLVSDAALISLGKTVEKMKMLLWARIDFSNCPKISDEGAIAYARSLSKLKRIRDVVMMLFACEGLTVNCKRWVGEILDSMPNLMQYTFGF